MQKRTNMSRLSTMLSPLFTFLFICTLNISLSGQLPDSFFERTFMEGFDFPTGLTFDENGRMYVWEKQGKIWVIDTTEQLLETPLIDISEEVANWKDHGLMSVALDPGFLFNGYFYLLYAVDPHYDQFFGTPTYSPDSTSNFVPTYGRVTRFQADPATNFSTTISGSRKVLLGVDGADGISIVDEFHGLGSIIMGDDRTLLISSGDSNTHPDHLIGGGEMIELGIQSGVLSKDADVGSYRSQYLGSLNGKIIRIDSETGDGLPSNPYFLADTPRAPQSRVWVMGLRNPYRIILKPETGSHFPEDGQPGTIFIGDVGRGKWEEINIAPTGGLNFGWPILTGYNWEWEFFTSDCPENPLAPNPLFNGLECIREHFIFRDLLPYPSKGQTLPLPNPCDPTQFIPASVYPHLPTPPVIAWSNAKWNKPTRAVIPAYDNANLITPLMIDDPTSTVTSEHFDGFSSMAGVFYTGESFPEEYHGTYFNIDFSGWIKQFIFNDENELLEVKDFHSESLDIIHLAQNPVNGNLYYVTIDAKVKEISYGGNPAPIAQIKADQFYGPSPLTVAFDGGNSFDPNESTLTYLWEFGNGQTSTELKPEITFTSSTNEPTSFTVKLTVTDIDGLSGTTEQIVSLNNTPPVVRMTSINDGDLYPMDRTSLLRLESEVTDLEHSPEEMAYEWQVFLHHNNHFHPEPVDYNPTSYTLISPLGCEIEEYWYRIELKVTDPNGLSTKVSNLIYPYCGTDFVQFTSLEAEGLASRNKLTWTTNTEENITFFEIQRSADFFNFEAIATVSAKGGTNTSTAYEFFDSNPDQRKNIYRVKVVNASQAFTYSNLATVSQTANEVVKIFPNPANNSFNVDLLKVSDESVNFELFTPTGSILAKYVWQNSVDQPFSRMVDTSTLPIGVYFYRLKTGEEEVIGSILIAR